ncbi:MAG: hypothetical protein K1X94_30830 [Sandaracinaceae bacterium]|nr:hypothetical protein [Sandaracinaceae bacterium]
MVSGPPDAPVSPSSRQERSRSLVELVGGVVGIALATLALSWLSAHVRWPIEDPLAARLAFVLAFAWVGLASLTTASLARGHRATSLAIAGLLGVALLLTAALSSNAIPSPVASSMVMAALLLACSSAGALVGARIQHAGHLGVVALVSSIADLASVLGDQGPSAQIAASAPTLSLLAIGGPMLGTPDLPPMLGAGDLVMISLYAAAAHRFALPERRTWVALAAGVIGAMIAVLALERALPALPFVGVAFVVAHPSTRLPPTHERRTAALGVLVLAALALWLLAR